jgi:lipoprotein-anchoring transpeptidase ErfK/SrfK
MKFDLRLAAVLLLAAAAWTCQRAGDRGQEHHQERDQARAPELTAAPLEEGRGQWKIAAADNLTVSVSAPGARQVRLLGRPEGAEGQIELATLTAPHDAAARFSTELSVPPDFAGELSAEAAYPDGTTRETASIAVTSATDRGRNNAEAAPHSTGGSAGTDESARSDRLTGGRIERARLRPGDPNIRITINGPSFQLTLWQSGKEVAAYHIGIGREDFPLPVGEREATAIIFNPRWIPPDSAWVQRTPGVEPDERAEPDDPRNPLGKIKIPLGDGYLIHAAAKPSDIGRLVSHGCVRLLTDDLYDLAAKIIAARSLPVSREQIEQSRATAERLAVKLEAPLLVDVNYDTQVVEGGVLRLYPDVYGRGAFSVESLRAELQSAGADPARLDERTLRAMTARVSREKLFAIRVADVKAGRFDAGWTEPLIAGQVARGAARQKKR